MIQARYNPISSEKEQKRDRFQLFSSSFILFVTLMDVFDNPTTISLLFGIISCAIGGVHLFCAIRYDHLKNFLGSRFEVLLFRITGIVFLINGIMMRYQGSGSAYLVHLALGLFYIFGLARIVTSARKRAILKVDDQGFHFKRLRRGFKTIQWSDIDELKTNDDCIILKHNGKKRPRTFWVEKDAEACIRDLKTLTEQYHST